MLTKEQLLKQAVDVTLGVENDIKLCASAPDRVSESDARSILDRLTIAACAINGVLGILNKTTR